MRYRTDYEIAKELRLKGESYGEIRSSLNIPKSTLSVWFSKLKLSQKSQEILMSKQSKGILALAEFNKKRTKKIKEENETIRIHHKSKITRLSKRELMIVGAALYWGEGRKRFNNKRRTYPSISFANSDPKMISLFINFLEQILGLNREHIKAKTMLYPNLDPVKAVNYWSKITGIPKQNFCFYISQSRASRGKRPKYTLPHGTLQLDVHKRQEFFKIRGLIDGMIETNGV